MTERLIVLDTETTGLDVNDNHRIIEIGCIEIVDRVITNNSFHQYLNPQRRIDPGAVDIHGITNERLNNEPIFQEIKDKFISYIRDAEVIAHNATFDIGFIESELKICGVDIENINSFKKIHDTLKIAREIYPGKRNSLDALCKRLAIDNSERDLHGALLDAKLLAQVYLKMTIGQTSFENLVSHNPGSVKVDHKYGNSINREENVIKATLEDIDMHKNYFSK